MGGTFWNIIQQQEAQGMATPISQHDGYREYTYKWGTDSALWFGLDPNYGFGLMGELDYGISGGINGLQKSKTRGTRFNRAGLSKVGAKSINAAVKVKKQNIHAKAKVKKGLRHRRQKN